MWIKSPIDLLYFEHSILRVRFSIALSLLDKSENEAIEILEKTHDFIVNWHAKIEDKYVFPLFGDKAKPFSNDHLLIEKYGGSAIKERRKDWIKRYVKIVLDHNLNEEVMLFSDSIVIKEDVMKYILDDAKKYPLYSELTGLRLQ
ncbi:cation-binding protein [Sulfolobus sp. A20]|uniref:hemerythrin domain-containing protein n=1 Tax=Sulfolobaceae TaxID=118883 RepID=UPI0008461FFC|nr:MULTISPECIES: cation-binding protein [unclassified Sulfolobus]TRM74551.1 cation-binding protein [Sulfolobus sp. B5]TRM76387.1 cation-binding protein [Sulfolobus sp. A20-N-F8]TRM83879.1 cation-binding protein [Sulfolobus sp. A20-N-F6]TRM84864.1 cation-binding protein [Sulfolobus sp. F3]TRM86356.1 cation-binding protein [Sulfolobus sp. A20-N-G8]TRM89474.1 cation-binding protein [Sulfolobus sp. C3]TRN00061.1 cation-binding protein [Sulfolobus sp. E1]TRN03187.1 cation-binding protein [Sulfol